MSERKPFREIFKQHGPFLIPLPYFNKAKSSACLSCVGACASVCPEKIVIKTGQNIPYLDMQRGGCTFCRACVKACEETCGGVLESARVDRIDVLATIDPRACLSYQKVICFTCKDACNIDAIAFKGMFYPSIQEHCTSCGMCVGVCPGKAIALIPPNGG